jgi:hypothetical protein
VLIIHIGTQKTGTKALQGFLRRNCDALLRQGIRYLQAGREKGRGATHNEFARAMRGAADGPIWGVLRQELAQSDSRIDVLSAEGLWFRDPAALKQQLPDVRDFQIVVYLRRQDQYLQSLYMQAVSSGREYSFATWRDKVPDRGKYLSTLDQWAGAFGREAIIVRPYVRNGVVDTVGDFSRLMGAEGLASHEDHRRNPSPRRELLHFIRAFNELRLDVDEQRLFKALIDKNAAYARSCDLLTYQESLALLQIYAEENRILSGKYYHDETVPLFPELVPFETPERWDLDSEQYYRLTVDVLGVLTSFAAEAQESADRVNPVERAARRQNVADDNAGSRGKPRRRGRNKRQKRRAAGGD